MTQTNARIGFFGFFVGVPNDDSERTQWVLNRTSLDQRIEPENSTWQHRYVGITDPVTQAEYVLRWGNTSVLTVAFEAE